MDTLLPIIRRKRRPLLPVESLHDLPLVPTVVTAEVKPVEVVALKSAETVVTDEKPKSSDDEVS
jgi:hypothetical protein